MEWNYEKEWRLVYLREIKPGKQGKNIRLPYSMKPVKIITWAKYNQDKSSNKNLAADVADKLGIEYLTYRKFKVQVEN